MKRLALAVAVLGLLAGAVAAYLRYAPDRYDPLAPLAIAETPSLLTGLKIARLRGDAAACFAALDAAGVDYTRMADRETGPGCGFTDAAVLRRSQVSWGGGIRLSCPMLAALAVWVHHDVQPLAQSILGSPVARIDHLGTYACRNINGAAEGRRSQHARANALDVAGFTLADGRRISLARDWSREGPGQWFLHALRDRACGRFAAVLGPDYNRLHADHFHLDMGGSSLCR